MNIAELQNIEVDGVDTKDYPDLCDAYITYAEQSDGTPLSANEIDVLNDEHGDFVHEKAHEYLHGREVE